MLTLHSKLLNTLEVFTKLWVRWPYFTQQIFSRSSLCADGNMTAMSVGESPSLISKYSMYHNHCLAVCKYWSASDMGFRSATIFLPIVFKFPLSLLSLQRQRFRKWVCKQFGDWRPLAAVVYISRHGAESERLQRCSERHLSRAAKLWWKSHFPWANCACLAGPAPFFLFPITTIHSCYDEKTRIELSELDQIWPDWINFHVKIFR